MANVARLGRSRRRNKMCMIICTQHRMPRRKTNLLTFHELSFERIYENSKIFRSSVVCFFMIWYIVDSSVIFFFFCTENVINCRWSASLSHIFSLNSIIQSNFLQFLIIIKHKSLSTNNFFGISKILQYYFICMFFLFMLKKNVFRN